MNCTQKEKKSSTLNEFYITMSKNRAWAVNLPVALKIKPKTKYFFFKTFNESKDEALNAAIDYRNAQLNKWAPAFPSLFFFTKKRREGKAGAPPLSHFHRKWERGGLIDTGFK
uniref:Uncharacterized protein n=1 Tax=Morchella importuna TaxID=1174673 RepID=A0A650AG53_9PEZI|nr:hypothetical protein [Morchella importuna]QGN66748.1 hypothetical protein [Morchella importuna]